MQNSPIPPKQAPKSRHIWLWAMLACFLVAAVAGAMFASSGLLDKPSDKKKPRTQKQEQLLTAHDKATIMIMGVDERADDVGRSDTLMVATLDPVRNRAALLSIPRDTRVSIRGLGYDKINAAYAYGGEPLAQSTVENFLGLDIDHYIVINTQSFVKIIDAIGGIDINVEKRMYYVDPWDDDGGLVIDLYPGPQHMDGKTAVTYVRYRDEEGDIGRIKRQQNFMRACMDKLASPSIITSLPSVISEVMDAVNTDLSVRQLLEFAGTLKEARENGLATEMVPGYPLYIDGVSYWIPDVEDLRLAVADTLGVNINKELRSNFERAAQEYKASIPSTAKDVPAGDTSIGKPVPSARNTKWTDTTDWSAKTAPPDAGGKESAGEIPGKGEEGKTSGTEKKDEAQETPAERSSPNAGRRSSGGEGSANASSPTERPQHPGREPSEGSPGGTAEIPSRAGDTEGKTR